MIDYQRLTDVLFNETEQGEKLYAILDGARTVEIASALQNVEVEKVSLYRGRSEEALWDVAPYLVRCERGAPFMQWLLERGWGNSWGIFLISSLNTEDLRKHFQQLLLIKRDNGKKFYFRFYDPRVLRVFLSSCDLDQSQEMFGPVRCFLIEALNPDTLLKLNFSEKGVLQNPINISNRAA